MNMKNVIDETKQPAPSHELPKEMIDKLGLNQDETKPETKEKNYTGIIIAALMLVIGIAVAMYINNKKKKELTQQNQDEKSNA